MIITCLTVVNFRSMYDLQVWIGLHSPDPDYNFLWADNSINEINCSVATVGHFFLYGNFDDNNRCAYFNVDYLGSDWWWTACDDDEKPFICESNDNGKCIHTA